MATLDLHDWHAAHDARFGEVNGRETVAHYGDPLAEHRALRDAAGVLDLSFRGRLCLTGADRWRFLNGQVTNNVKDLLVGHGCYAALVSAKGKLESDLNLYCLEGEFLVDFEPGLSLAVTQRFEKYIIADDVQVVDAAPHCGLLSVQGPKAEAAVRELDLGIAPPNGLMGCVATNLADLGAVHLTNLPRTGSAGFDFFVPRAAQAAALERLIAALRAVGGRVCGWQALEIARIEAGIPRYGADMDGSNLAPEAGLEPRAISYTKGCYIGQEVIARLRTYGQVTRSLRGLRLDDALAALPARGDKLFAHDREVGYITSAVASPTFQANLALGYVRRESNQAGTELTVRTDQGTHRAMIVELPFAMGLTRP